MASAEPTFVGLDRASSICTTGHPANILTGMFVRMLQQHFGSPDNLEYQGSNEFTSFDSTTSIKQLQNYIWTSGPDTKIQIQPVWQYNPQDIQNRPAIYIKRNTFQPQRLAINDGFTLNAGRDATGKPVVHGELKSVLIVGSHTLFAVGNSGAEAELLGSEVFELLLTFGQKIREDLNLNKFTALETGEVALLDEFDEHYVVPVVAGYAFTWSWRIDKIAPWFKTAAVDLRSAT